MVMWLSPLNDMLKYNSKIPMPKIFGGGTTVKLSLLDGVMRVKLLLEKKQQPWAGQPSPQHTAIRTQSCYFISTPSSLFFPTSKTAEIAFPL